MTKTLLCLLASLGAVASAAAEPLKLELRSRTESEKTPGRFEVVQKTASWEPKETAAIVCDMWDVHWCRSATERVAEMAPRMNQLLARLRSQGVLIIHCPSETMAAYADHPGRKLAQGAPPVDPPPPRAPAVKEGPFPIDHADGGCPDDPPCRQHKAWGRQIAAVEILDGDAIGERDEPYRLMRQRGIKNVAILGVHTNMCILNRPFAIKALVGRGMNVVLVRDMTDTMYNPKRRPEVDHFTGTDLVVEFIEKYWCPTIASDQVLGGAPFRFAADKRGKP